MRRACSIPARRFRRWRAAPSSAASMCITTNFLFRSCRASDMDIALDRFATTFRSAAATRTPLRFRGGGTKDFYGQALHGEIVETRDYAGIVDYDPTELVITARC